MLLLTSNEVDVRGDSIALCTKMANCFLYSRHLFDDGMCDVAAKRSAATFGDAIFVGWYAAACPRDRPETGTRATT